MILRAAKCLLALLPLLLLSAAARIEVTWPHDAYIWQRAWTPALADAIRASDMLIDRWRVLAAETDRQGLLQPVRVDAALLAASAHPVILVFRIDGQLAQWDRTAMIDRIAALIDRWAADGRRIDGIEIDHDCATARLSAYADFLATLHARLGDAHPLSITALPTWLRAPAAARVFAQADEIVLQVHAVQEPQAGLFDRRSARRWIDTFARHSSKPFRVALPAYGARVSWRGDGTMLAVESEMPVLSGGHAAAELMARPADVARLLRDLETDPPPRLRGIVWFRLPTRDDRRAWSVATWQAVIRGTPLQPHLAVALEDSDTAGMRYVALDNDGEVDAELPRRIALPGACALADGVNGYVLGHEAAGLAIERQQAGLLHPHHRQLIGWVRCASAAEELHVDP